MTSMTRRILLGTFVTWSCLCQAEPNPSVNVPTRLIVKLESPPQSLWFRLEEMAFQAVLSGGVALVAVWLTNRYNRTQNEANRRHDRARWRMDRQFDMKRDAITRAVSILLQSRRLLMEHFGARRAAVDQRDTAKIGTRETSGKLAEAAHQMLDAIGFVSLATSSSFADRLEPLLTQLLEFDVKLESDLESGRKVIHDYFDRTVEFIDLARKELYSVDAGVSEVAMDRSRVGPVS